MTMDQELDWQLLDAVPRLVPGTDPVQHENDVLFVVNTALSEFNIRDISGFADWLHRQELNAKISHMWDEGSKHFRAPPTITQLAKYLRKRRAEINRSNMTRM